MTVEVTLVFSCPYCSYSRSLTIKSFEDLQKLTIVKSAYESVKTHNIIKHRERSVQTNVINNSAL